MKVLCISDDVDPLIYSSGIQERFRHIDIILSAGDLYFNYYNYIVSMLNKPLYFVFGNHNLKQLHHYRKSIEYASPSPAYEHYRPAGGGTYVGGKVLYLKKHKLIIGGLGGCRRYSNGPNQFTELQMFGKILTLIPHMIWNRIIHGRYIDILITHAAPLGIGDRQDLCHKGFKVFLWFMKAFKPRYLLHGHIHLYDINLPRASQYGETQVINVYSRYELEL
ncbi:MAG: metallophosphoesterase [Spirochaetota bacterium]